MKKFYLLLIILLSFQAYSQQVIRFDYDIAGNQTVREFCSGCTLRQSNQPIKEISEIKDEDLQKFFPDDVISYYPNPVRDELYLKWELVDNNKVVTIDLYTLNGQLLKNSKQLETSDSHIISFQDLPTGIYLVNLNYKNGEMKSIKIIKK